MNNNIKTIAHCGVGFGGHLAMCFTAAAATPFVAAAVGLAITPVAGMAVGLGLATTIFVACGGYKKPAASAGFVALGLAAFVTHCMFFMGNDMSDMSLFEAIANASRCFTPQ
ncbi:MAG: hypothetical protein CMH30_09510 [Micavibrio sp.]|nr:hypothetical protein [Micavibrio sp.]